MRLITRAMCLVFVLSAALGAARPALAISESNKALLTKHFASLGTVKYDLYAPLGGPELGGALIDSNNSTRLEVVSVGGHGELSTLYSAPLTNTAARPPFTFFLGGKHMLLYPTMEVAGADGLTHAVGDLAIYDLLAAGGIKKLFELKNVADLTIGPGGAQSLEALIWQPSRHLLNTAGMLPAKYSYFRLIFDAEKGEYRIYQHLMALPEAATVDAANLNNRAIAYYNTGRLLEASRLLEQASRLTETDQSVVTRNQALIKSEITDIVEQGKLRPDLPYDEALAAYWQGDFNACLRALEGRQPFSVHDIAILGLALAWTERWPEVDQWTVELERRQAPYLADYLSELVKISRMEGFDQIAGVYLTALSVTDQTHPGYVANLAELEIKSNEGARAQQMLSDYLMAQRLSGRDLSEPRLVLYRLLLKKGDQAGCDKLAADALADSLYNLAGAVRVLDYMDLSSALTDIPLEGRDRIKAPAEPLEGLSLPEQQEHPLDPKDAVKPIEH